MPEEQIALLSSGAISGSGLTEDDPLIITSATEWREVMTYVSGRGTYNQYGRLLKHIALGENISLNNETWYGVNLNGKTFDGRGHTISGIKQPLFGIADGTVKNLVVSDAAIKETSTGTPVGAIAGKTSGTFVIQNCYVNGKLSNANDAVGGLVGEVSGGTTSVQVQNCVVDAEIVNTGDYINKSLAGGLIGHIPQFGTEITIEKCITLGCKVLLLKCGAKGMYLQTAGEEKLRQVSVRTELDVAAWAEKAVFEKSYIPEKILSGTGAGDTSIAAFLTAMLEGNTPEMCLHLAAATGASCVAAYDALSGLKSFEELKKKIEEGWEKVC